MNDDSRIGYANQVYTNELVSVLKEPVYNSIMDIYRREANMSQNKNNILIEFQKRLKDVPNWNQNIIDENVQKASVNCGFLQDLLSAVYFSNVKILSSVKIKKSKKKVHIKLPELDDFIHKIMIELARRVYNNPKLFSIRLHGIDMNNKESVYPLIEESICETIIKMLPFQNLLQTYFGDKLHGGDSSSDSSSDDDSSGSESDKEDEQANFPEEPTTEETPPVMQPQQGFFDRPQMNEPEEYPEQEIKEIPVQGQNFESSNEPKKQPPIFFPDAADDPTEETN